MCYFGERKSGYALLSRDEGKVQAIGMFFAGIIG